MEDFKHFNYIIHKFTEYSIESELKLKSRPNLVQSLDQKGETFVFPYNRIYNSTKKMVFTLKKIKNPFKTPEKGYCLIE